MEKNVWSALLDAQKEFPEIPKNRTANVGTYSYTYADLASIKKLVDPVLHRHGLVYSQPSVVSEGKEMLRTVLRHPSSDTEIVSDRLLKTCANPQEAGSDETYKRRYNLTRVLGIVADDDDDGNLAVPSPAKKQKPSTGGYPSGPQVKRAYAIAMRNNWTHEQYEELLLTRFGVKTCLQIASKEDYDTLCNDVLPKGPISTSNNGSPEAEPSDVGVDWGR